MLIQLLVIICSKIKSIPLSESICMPYSKANVLTIKVKNGKSASSVWKKYGIISLEFNWQHLLHCITLQTKKEYTTVILLQLIHKAVNQNSQVKKSFKLTFSSADTSAILGSGGGARFFIKSKTSRKRMILKYIRK